MNMYNDFSPRVTDTVFKINSLLIITFILEKIAQVLQYFKILNGNYFNLINTLSLQFNENFNIFTLFTHPLVHNDLSLPWGILNLFFGLLILIFFGSELEKIWGAHHFLKFFIIGILGSIVMSFIVSISFVSFTHNYIYNGISGGNAAILIAYTMFWPNRQLLFMFFFPIRMKWFILILFTLLLFSGSKEMLIQYAGGSIASALFLYYYARKGNFEISINNTKATYKNNKTSFFKNIIDNWKNKKHKKKLAKKQNEINERIAMKNQVDKLLEKISKQGINSLTKKEKFFLDKASKKI